MATPAQGAREPIPEDVPGLHQRHDGPGPLEIRLIVAKRLQQIRCRRGLSLQRLAVLSGVSFSTLYRIEGGGRMPTKRTVVRITQALNVDPGALFRPDVRRKDQRPAVATTQ
jgi:DNA-binding XRE family transcriptional regulator